MVIPSLFLAHGLPSLVLENNRYTGFLRKLGALLPKPRGIAMISAHWQSPVQRISGAAHPETLYDFFGYPQELYEIDYPAGGSIVLSMQIERLLALEGIACVIDDERGLDHGVWSILSFMYPAADIPVVALSVHPGLVCEEHYRIGRALSPLREQEILILGSGGTVHNLHSLSWEREKLDAWAVEFDEWLAEQIQVWDLEALFDYRRRAPHAAKAAPTEEHLAPLFVAMGAAAGGQKSRLLHKEYQYGSLSLSGWMFG